ncbi:MAG: hypothetical protein ACD_60C00079G0042 [uncultured bacterium]|nr:MAG: hypothetical protein ACD_60C00079G0042 [uncultured bacterium]
MKYVYWLVIVTIITLTGCIHSTSHNHAAKKSHAKKNVASYQKNPIDVSLYLNDELPKQPYVILGKTAVSKYNKGGIKRPEAIIHDAILTAAASLGGDAVILIKHHRKTVTGTVIAYQKKMNV